MNINQAKAVAEISYSLSGRSNLERARQDCKALIVSARKSGDDARAAELSEAWQVFKKRAHQHRCDCGHPISASATKCRFCMRPRTLPIVGAPLSHAKAAGRKGGNVRVTAHPAGGMLADLGFYTAAVQKVVARWIGRIPPERLEDLFSGVAMPLRAPGFNLTINNTPEIVTSQEWQAAYEMGAALAGLYNSGKPEAWLLKQPDIHINGEAPHWEEVATAGGFSINALKKAAERMRLLTPPKVAKQFIKSERSRSRVKTPP